MSPQRVETLLLAAILAGYLLVAGLYATRTAPWQAPDEPAHYNVIAQIAVDGCCPVIEMGDWDSAYLDALKAARFAPTLTDNLASVQYEDHQPPLYYLLLAPVYRATGGDLTALRLVSVALGAGVVLLAYTLARLLLPARRGVALGTAALVAYIPQHAAILGSVNNDALAYLLAAAVLVLCALYVTEHDPVAFRRVRWGFSAGAGLLALVALLGLPWGRPGALWAVPALFAASVAAVWWLRADSRNSYHVILGTVVGAAFLTKTTVYFTVGVVVVAVVLRPLVLAARSSVGRGAGIALRVANAVSKLPLPNISPERERRIKQAGRRFGWDLLKNARSVYAPVLRRHARKIGRGLAVVVGVSTAYGLVWWARNSVVYGFPDVLGLTAHDVVVVGQLRTAERIADVGWAGYWRGAVTTTFHSFWGQLGWMALPLPATWYPPIGAMLGVAAAGLVVDARRSPRPPSAHQVVTGVLLGLTGLAALAQFVYYNLSFYQVQGRYLFVALLPFALVVVAGLDGWVRLLRGRVQRAGQAPSLQVYVPYIMPLALAAAFGAANLWLLRFVVPALAP